MQVVSDVGQASHLNEYLPQGDERSAKLSQEQAADEEISLLLSEELGDKMSKERQDGCRQGDKMTIQTEIRNNFWETFPAFESQANLIQIKSLL